MLLGFFLATLLAAFFVTIRADRFFDELRARRKAFSPVKAAISAAEWLRNREAEREALEYMRVALVAAGQKA